MKNSALALIILIFIALAASGLWVKIGCNSLQKQLPTESHVKELFDRIYGLPGLTPDTCLVNISSNIDVYLDRSGSMRGFINDDYDRIGATSYCDFLRNLDGYLRAKVDTVMYYKFGTSIQVLRNCSDAIVQPSFYDETETRLAQLIDNLSKAVSKNLPRSILIITDGIQSTPEREDFREMISAISNWLSRGFSFEILMMQSEFNGFVYSEALNGRQLDESYKSSKYGKRHFFVFVLSPKKGFGKQLISTLSAYSDTTFTHYIDFTSKLFDSPKAELRFPSISSPAEKSCLQNYSGKKYSDIKYLFWENNCPSGDFELIVEFIPKNDTEDFIMRYENIRPDIEAIALRSADSIPSPKIDLFGTSFDHKKGMTRLKCSFHIEQLGSGDWIAYRIFLRPGSGTILPLQWVSDVSSKTDLTAASFSKTLYFREFVTSLIQNSRLSEQPIGVFYLVIKERKR